MSAPGTIPKTEPSAPAATPGAKRGVSDAWLKTLWPLIALFVALAYNYFFSEGFFNIEVKDGRLFGSLIDILNRASPIMLISLGMTLVIATAGVDLSVGAVMAISGSLAAMLISQNHLPIAAIISICLAVSVVAGLWNGLLVGFFKIPPIVATLILMVSGRGIAQLITGGEVKTFHNAAFEYIGRGALFGLPFTVTITVAAFFFLTIFTRATAAGLFIEATGDNETASQYAGVHTRLVKLIVYSLCALLAGVAGFIPTADIAAADATHTGEFIELDAILATVIGGTPLTGGRFNLTGSIIGAILIQTLTITIRTKGVPDDWAILLKAIVIVGVCLLQSETFRKKIFGSRKAKA